MSKPIRRLTHRRVILLKLAVLVLGGGGVAALVFWASPMPKSLQLCTIVQSGSTRNTSRIPTVSVQRDLPRQIAGDTKCILSMPWRRSSPKPKDGDVTFSAISHKLCKETHRKDYWAKLRNSIAQTLGRSATLPEWNTVDQWLVGESDKLYVRLTPAGQFYISTAEDREHMIHASLLDDDPNLAAGVTTICQDHWADWAKKADALAKVSAPDKGKR